jgi:WD40 repeat protein
VEVSTGRLQGEVREGTLLKQNATRYDVFMSYSQKLDNQLAPELQKGLRALGRRWDRPYALRVFRDKTGLGVNPSLWAGIEAALSKSDYFVLLASPLAARSVWVRREVEWWQSHRSPSTMLLALTDGAIVWDEATGDFDWTRTDALPECLSGWFTAEPNYADLRWARKEVLSLQHSRFRSEVAGLSAAITGVDKDKIEGEDIRQQRVIRRLKTGTIGVLGILLVGALAATVLAVVARREAQDQQRVAAARSLITASDAVRDNSPPDIDTALRLGAAAYANMPSPETASSLAQTLSSSPLAAVLPHRFGQDTRMVFSPGGMLLATADAAILQLWNLGGGRPELLGKPLENGHLIEFLALSPDEKLLAAAGVGVATLWDITDPAAPVRVSLPPPEINSIRALKFSPDGRLLAAGFGDSLTLWSLSDRTAPRIIGAIDVSRYGDVESVAFADATTIAVGYRDPYADNFVSIWEVRDAADIRDLTGSWATSSLAHALLGLSHDDSRIIASSESDLASVRLDGRNSAFHPTAGSLVTPIDLWNTRSTADRSVAITVATTAVGRAVIWWDITSAEAPREVRRLTIEHAGDIRQTALSADGRWFATASISGQVILWDLTDSHRPRRLPATLGGLDGDISAVVFARRRPVVAVSGGDKVRLWDLTTGRPEAAGQVQRPGKPVGGMAISPDGRILAVGGYDQTTTLWNIDDLSEPRLIGKPLSDFTNNVTSVEFSPDGRLLAVTGHPAMMLWNVTDPERPQRLSPIPVGRTSTTTKLAFSPDGHTVAAARGSDVALYDVSDVTKPMKELRGTHQSVTEITFSSDGRTLATGGLNPAVTLWDITSRDRPSPIGQPLPGYLEGVRRLAFAPDGRTLVVVAGSARLWDITDRQRPRPLGPPIEVTGQGRPVAFAANGQTLAVTFPDREVALWDLHGLNDLRENLLRAACARMSSVLDKTLWAFYAPGLTYREGCAY